MTFGYRLNARANFALRRLLRADRPVADRSNEEFAAEVEKNYRWNFAVNMMDGAAFWFGLSFISPITILPLFISKLTYSPLPLAIVSAVALGGWYLPQLFSAPYVEMLSHKKAIIVNLGFFFERLPVWTLPLAALLAVVSLRAALVVFLFAYTGLAIGAGVVATGWQGLIARCFPMKKRGRFLRIIFFLGAGTGAIGAIFSAQLLETLPFPDNFAVIFLISAVAITLAWVFLSLTREPLRPATAPRRLQREFFAALPGLLRQDRNFNRFLRARILLALGNMGLGFLTVAALGRWDVSDRVVGLYTTLLLVGQTAGNLNAGIMADRFGYKFSLELSAAAGMIGFVISWQAPTPEWYLSCSRYSGSASVAWWSRASWSYSSSVQPTGSLDTWAWRAQLPT